ncbi:hypothetical protein BP6252_08855 [Coleophoma cylindrospora]|uniref:Uncharacterized protein n=1 Tax=Coleophoma cylindrospora TaxID=1849047 RepID=A0A3D8R711_9HELO|nr:hypothetical protein BP6252_08855 [Coleophoma cylindrospora]
MIHWQWPVFHGFAGPEPHYEAQSGSSQPSGALLESFSQPRVFNDNHRSTRRQQRPAPSLHELSMPATASWPSLQAGVEGTRRPTQLILALSWSFRGAIRSYHGRPSVGPDFHDRTCNFRQ